MRLYYYQDPIGNFGDDLNPWLWPRILPKPVGELFDDETLFIGIGSLLNSNIPQQPARKVVFGTGCGYGPKPKTTNQWHFYCVRGPLSAGALDLVPSMAVTDSGALIREVVAPAAATRHRAAFMPHHLTHHTDRWALVCEAIGMTYVDPTAPVESTLEAIRGSGVLITESLHGAIVADTLRVPWVPVRTRRRIAEFKWQDWSQSVGVEHRFEWLPPTWSPEIDWRTKRLLHPFARRVAAERLQWLARFGRRRLSRESTFNETYARLRSAFGRMVADAA